MRYPDSSTSIWKRRQKFIPEEGNDPSAIKCTSFKKKIDSQEWQNTLQKSYLYKYARVAKKNPHI